MRILAAEIHFEDGIEYVATQAFATLGSDIPANKIFRGRLADVRYERSVSFASWRGDRNMASPVQEIVLLNADGRLDSWRTRPIRDQAIVLLLGRAGDPYSTWVVRARLTGDDVSATRDRLVIKCKGKLQRTEREATAAWPASAPNTEIAGSRRPIAIGRLAFATGVLYHHYSNFERFYAVSDWPIYGIEYWWSRYLPPTNYSTQAVPAAIYGLRRRSATTNPGPDDRLCLEMRGAVSLGNEQLGADGDFDSWTGDVPDGWEVNDGKHGGLVYEGPTGSATIIGEDVWIEWDGLVASEWYQVEVIGTLDSGVFMITNGTADLWYQFVDSQLVGSERAWRITFQAHDTTLRIGIPESATGHIIVHRVRVWPVEPVDRITRWVHHLLRERVGLNALDIDDTSWDALEAAKPYDLAFASPQGIMLDELLWRALDSLDAAAFESVEGKVAGAWLQNPAAMTPVGVITTADLVGGWEPEDDGAEGLSTSLVHDVNYCQLSETELQSLTAVVTLPTALIESLRRADRKVSATATPHSHYSRAADQGPVPTLIVGWGYAQTEINYRVTVYGSRRSFWSATLRDRAKFATMDPGQCWEVQDVRHGTFKAFVALVSGTLLGSEPVLRVRVWR